MAKSQKIAAILATDVVGFSRFTSSLRGCLETQDARGRRLNCRINMGLYR